MREDVCVDNVGLSTMQSSRSQFKSSILGGSANNEITTNSGNKKQKESALINLSNKVKLLERNFSTQSNTLIHLETRQDQTHADVVRILKSLTKADQVLKDSASDSAQGKIVMAALNEKIKYLESELVRMEEILYIGCGVILAAVMSSIILIFCFCQNSTPEKSSDSVKSENFASTISTTIETSETQTEEKVPEVKKVTFNDVVESEPIPSVTNEDISAKLFTVRRKKDVSRRVTWCSGNWERNTAIKSFSREA